MGLIQIIVYISLVVYATTYSSDFLENPRTDDIIFECPDGPKNLQMKVYRQLNIKPIRGVTQEVVFTYPEYGESKEVIRCIKVTDLGNGQDAVIEAGGIGFRHVTIRFRGKRNKESGYFIGIWEEKSRFEDSRTEK